MIHYQMIALETYLENQYSALANNENKDHHLYLVISSVDGDLYFCDLAPHFEGIGIEPIVS